MKRVKTHPPKYLFNALGIRFDVPYLRIVKPEIVNLDVKELSEFVDMVTYENTLRGRTVISATMLREFSYKAINTTSAGNAAFISLYHPNEIQRELGEKILAKIKNLIQHENNAKKEIEN